MHHQHFEICDSVNSDISSLYLSYIVLIVLLNNYLIMHFNGFEILDKNKITLTANVYVVQYNVRTCKPSVPSSSTNIRWTLFFGMTAECSKITKLMSYHSPQTGFVKASLLKKKIKSAL